MKKIIAFAVCILMLSGCFYAPAKNMTVSRNQPVISRQNDKATLVIIRNTSFLIDSNSVISNYLGRKLIGETNGKTYFVTEVPPGPNYLIAVAENIGTAHFVFEAGKIYYLLQGILMGMVRDCTSGFWPMTPHEAEEAFKNCEYLAFSPKGEIKDLSQDIYEKAIREYNEDIAQYPEGYRAILNYKGY